MKERGSREDACSLGFAELFTLAKGRAWTPEEKAQFDALDQNARNERVSEWAREAGRVATEDRIGTDGRVYRAFWKE